MTCRERYEHVRSRTQRLCAPLAAEDYCAQPIVQVSPPKWHLGHTAWYFETFLLLAIDPTLAPFDPSFGFLFNSYYEGAGPRVRRDRRGTLTRPSLERVLAYRRHVDEHVCRLLDAPLEPRASHVLEIGIHHEQQHQELLLTDIKYILGTQPTHPAYGPVGGVSEAAECGPRGWVRIEEGIYEIGARKEDGFSFDNERPRHRVYLQQAEVRSDLVSNADYLEFVRAGGYRDPRLWHADGWAWVQAEGIEAPLYWRREGDGFLEYTLNGLAAIDGDAPVCHVSYYEAAAFAAWAGARLPTEAEWEVAAPHLSTGARWEWTGSAYLPYPGFEPEPGVLGEYNGKFMVNQMVLRGGSVATPPGHARPTYRNFFYPHERWQYTGIRLAR